MKIIWYPAVSLDGYIADAKGNSDWVTAEDDQMWGQLVQSARAVIVGRRTFNQYYGQVYPIPGATTYVMTTDSGLRSEDPAVVYVVGGAMAVMRRLSEDGHRWAVLSGGGESSGLFAAANLIDEAWISTYPIVLGSGTRLLGKYEGPMRLIFREGYSLPGGVNHSRYDIG
jgi:dihydrofolate reductase